LPPKEIWPGLGWKHSSKGLGVAEHFQKKGGLLAGGHFACTSFFIAVGKEGEQPKSTYTSPFYCETIKKK